MSNVFPPSAIGENVSDLACKSSDVLLSNRPAQLLAQEPEHPVRVLVIDDDIELLEHIVEALDTQLFDVRTASRMQELDLHLDSFTPDIVITDLAMPTHDGTDVLRQLRERSYAGIVVLMSGTDGHVLETMRRMAVSLGLTIGGVLRKPFNREQLRTVVGAGVGSEAHGSNITTALLDRRIRPYFQPKIDLRSGKIVGAEALSRWLHPKNGVLLPQGYLSATRASGKQSLHDLTMLERAAEFCSKLNAVEHRIKVAVNFTADVVLGDHFLEVIADIQCRYGIAPEQLIIEMTEREAVENYQELAERLLKVRLFGAHLSMDDFGTGYSSLRRIQQLPVSEVKIDRTFVDGLAEDAGSLAIVRSIVELAHSLDCVVVAQGVETLEVLDHLTKLGCDMAQGHFFSPAVNEATFMALIRDNASAQLESKA